MTDRVAPADVSAAVYGRPTKAADARRPHRRFKACATVALIGAAAVCLFLLLFRPDYQARLDPAVMQPTGGHAFAAVLPRSERLVYELVSDLGHANRSELALREDGTPLGPAHSLHDAVRGDGKGAFSHWGGAVVFAASDNTDPRTNGRTYLANAKYDLRRNATIGLLAAFVAVPLLLAWLWIEKIAEVTTGRYRWPWNIVAFCLASQGVFLIILCLGARYRASDEFIGFTGTMFIAPFALYAFLLRMRKTQ